ncbi:hypothetical protein QBC39DRAFT_161099 [Podospora conica]|nr:hypothetical protein QBC39DRAFT_161099 [Schizothecium conicum]
MALTAQPTAHSSWADWPQQHSSREYGLTDPALMPFEPRHVNPGPLPRPPLSPQYYSTPFSGAPMNAMVAPHYPHQGVHYGGYAPFPPSPAMEFKQDPLGYEERSQLALHSVETPMPSPHAVNDCSSSMQRSRSTSVNSETHMSSTAPRRRPLPTSSRPSPKVITTNIPVSEEVKVDFNTGVDTLMKAIQAQVDPDMIANSVRSEVQAGTGSDLGIKTEQVRKSKPRTLWDVSSQDKDTDIGSPDNRSASPLPHGDFERSRKRYVCAIKGCSKTFSQKTHLETHRRAHTGEKPYVCKIPGCERAFSQHGNLTTHMRRHTGEKPFNCDQCGRRFAQRGNLKSHTRTHTKIKPFVCKLDDCKKTFTERGNLKCHLNKFHLRTLTELTEKFATMTNYEAVSKEEKELMLYFAEIFKNSNKGIKGRGRNRRVGCITQMTPPSANLMAHYPAHVHGIQQLHTPHPMHDGLPYYSFGHPAAYVGYHPIFDADVASVSSSVSGPMYEDDHGRNLSFGERMY